MDELKDKFKSLLKKPSKKPAFSGQGHRLGSDEPTADARKPRPDPSSGASGAITTQPGQQKWQQQPAARGVPQSTLNLQHATPSERTAPGQELKPATEFSPFTAVIGGGAARTTINMNPEHCSADKPASSGSATAHSTAGTAGSTSQPRSQQRPQQQHVASVSARRADVSTAAVEEMQHCLALVVSQPAVAASSMEVLHKLLSNLLAAPQEAKFRQLRLGPSPNPKIQANVLDVSGALDFLRAVGFEEVQADQSGGEGGTFAYFLDDAKLSYVESGLVQLQLAMQSAREAQHGGRQQEVGPSSQPPAHTAGTQNNSSTSTPATMTAAVPRNTLVLLPAAPDADVPAWFFERTAAEVKAEFMSLLKQRQTKQTFASKAWKDLQLGNSRGSGTTAKQPAVITLRVRFPEGVCLQGCFGACEPVTAVFEWVTQGLRDPCLSYDLITPSRTPLQHTGTVSAADLGGAVLLFRPLTEHQQHHLLDAAGRQQSFLSDVLLAQARAD